MSEPHAGPDRQRGATQGTVEARSHRLRHRIRRTLLVAVVVLVLIVAGAAGYLWYLNGQIHRVKVADLTRAQTTGARPNVENILLVGSTSRCALKTQDPSYGLCSQGVTGVNSDVIMILHLDPGTHVLSILSIPRDTFVPNARVAGANKIDAALAEGPNQLVDAIQEDFGIPIQHYVQLNFETFAGVVDALGGVKMYFPEPVYDAFSGLKVLTSGCLSLDGTAALQVVRARHLQYQTASPATGDPRSWMQETQSDLARIRRNHEFLRVLASALARRGLGNPITDQQIAAAVAPKLEVDSGLSAFALAHLILTFHTVNPYSAPQLTLPVAVTTFGTYRYKGGNYGEVAFPVQPADRQVINQFLGHRSETSSMTGSPLPRPSSVNVAVLNGSATPHQGSDTAKALQAVGFRIQSIGDSTPVGTHAETVVNYAASADQPAAEAVAESMTGFVILALDPTKVPSGAQVSVVTGTSFTVSPPPPLVAPPSVTPPSVAPPTPGSQPTSSATPAPTPSLASIAGYQPPTAAVEALAPWDPRSCAADGSQGP